MIPFFVAPNLTAPELTEGNPWDFNVAPAENKMKLLAKDVRRATLLKPKTQWQVYSPVRGMAKNLRVAKDNPPHSLHGLVVDYDMVTSVDAVLGYLNQIPASQLPNFIEISLSNKIRLVWVFERPILTPSSAFCGALISTFFDTMAIRTLLAGYDANSEKPAEVWTNGGEWYSVKETPLAWDFCFGVACEVSKKAALFNASEVPLDVIAKEVEKRFPNRWKGDFALDAVGVRFWDEKADNQTGAQIKPDGMLCFTGKTPFMRWTDILGTPWVEEQRVLNLGRAGEGFYFDGKLYWEKLGDRWSFLARGDILLRLKEHGMTDAKRKGQTISDAERVLSHIQQINRVEGAAPLINYKSGLIELQGRRILNIANLNPVQPVKGKTGTPEDFPWIWSFLNGLFARPELLPKEHWLAWMQRSYRAVLNYQRLMGQAIFLCGPKNNGKTLLCLRIIAPLLGNRFGNPMDYLVGDTNFNDDLFESYLLAVNDEDDPGTEARRKRMLAKLKGFVVNPQHKYHPKFCARLTIDWTGRLVVTLNDDPSAIGMLTEVSANTKDKQMFFATQAFTGDFPANVEDIIKPELPHFGWWLLQWAPPAEVLAQDRCGVKSFYDPRILALANQQTFSSNLLELLESWMRVDAFWAVDQKNSEWTGTPTDLLTTLQSCDPVAGVAREWTQQKVAKNLTALAKQPGSGVEHIGSAGREFKITRV